MQAVSLSKPDKKIHGHIHLTGSKSESNRALILEALSEGKVKIKNLSFADDTEILKVQIRNSKSEIPNSKSEFVNPKSEIPNGKSEIVNLKSEINIGPAGTAMRFLTAYLGVKAHRDLVLTGSERMQQRPIGVLVDAMRKLGAKISYAKQDGYPPLNISAGFKQATAELHIPGHVSSQFISALLMVAPALPQGLTLVIENELTSKPYVQMTLAMLAESGIRHSWKENIIRIEPQTFAESILTIEPDWSAASYWYSLVALSDDGDVFLSHLKEESLQGDSAIVSIMKGFGVQTLFTNGGLWLKKTKVFQPQKHFNLKECPDLAQTVIVCSAALGFDAEFSGLETLRIKETDRILALQNELAKIGVKLNEQGDTFKLDCSGKKFPQSASFPTYEDHRMAMALAPLALFIPEVHFDDKKVVGKSYPTFWKDLESVGFVVGS